MQVIGIKNFTANFLKQGNLTRDVGHSYSPSFDICPQYISMPSKPYLK
jgi:hypothetical protein